jgi:hypothetical protein
MRHDGVNVADGKQERSPLPANGAATVNRCGLERRSPSPDSAARAPASTPSTLTVEGYTASC